MSDHSIQSSGRHAPQPQEQKVKSSIHVCALKMNSNNPPLHVRSMCRSSPAAQVEIYTEEAASTENAERLEGRELPRKNLNF